MWDMYPILCTFFDQFVFFVVSSYEGGNSPYKNSSLTKSRDWGTLADAIKSIATVVLVIFTDRYIGLSKCLLKLFIKLIAPKYNTHQRMCENL